MSAPVQELPAYLPRHAFGPREVARAADLWRACQEAAVEASTRAGWSPARYREEGTAFVVRAMTVRHHREARYGDRLRARTWVTRFRRGMLSERQVRLTVEDDPIASATQEWVYVGVDLKPRRAEDALLSAFPVHLEGEPVTLPEADLMPGEPWSFSLRCWHTSMDPLGHVNHPTYIDWCDESTARAVASAGLDPASLVPVAERAQFRAGATAGDEVTVETRRAGTTSDGAVCLDHVIRRGDSLLVEVTTVRRLSESDPGALVEALGGR